MANSIRYAADRKTKLMPAILSVAVVLLDQLSKFIIVRTVTYSRPPEVAFSLFGDFFQIIHARNTGAAFSLGRGLPDNLRGIFFILLPLIVLGWIVVYYWRTQELSKVQRWCIAAVVGGGVGNLIDRVFRSSGVVDFIDVRVFGLFGLERWPTFNIADASVVVAGILFLFFILLEDRRNSKKTKIGDDKE